MTSNLNQVQERCEPSSSSTMVVYPVNDIAFFLARNTNKSIAAVKRMMRKIGIQKAFDIAVKKGFVPR